MQEGDYCSAEIYTLNSPTLLSRVPIFSLKRFPIRNLDSCDRAGGQDAWKEISRRRSHATFTDTEVSACVFLIGNLPASRLSYRGIS